MLLRLKKYETIQGAMARYEKSQPMSLLEKCLFDDRNKDLMVISNCDLSVVDNSRWGLPFNQKLE